MDVSWIESRISFVLQRKGWTLNSQLMWLVTASKRFLDGYKHVVNVTYSPAVNSDAPSFQQESAQGKAAAQVSPSSKKAAAYHDMLEGLPLFALCSKHSHWHLNVLSNTVISAARILVTTFLQVTSCLSYAIMLQCQIANSGSWCVKQRRWCGGCSKWAGERSTWAFTPLCGPTWHTIPCL